MTGRTRGNFSSEDIDKIAAAVARTLQSKFDAIEQKIDDLTSSCVTKPELEKTKANVRVGRYLTDELEQYTRRENVRIHNMRDTGDVPLLDAVVTLFNDIINFVNPEDAEGNPIEASDTNPGDAAEDATVGNQISASDISICHRVGKPSAGSKPRQVIVRFVSRQTVFKLFKFKKNLKNMGGLKEGLYKDVFVTDDLTQLRLKLRSVLKDAEGISNVYSRDGTLHCTKDKKQYAVSSPDDLHAIGIDVDLEKLGLGALE